LLPGDDPDAYDTELINGQRILLHRPDGACVYLGKRGCRIWSKRPKVCRAFDCRRFALQVLAGKHEDIIKDDAVMQAGLERLASLRES
jgi:Fe-S-cluster containining protein